MQLVGGLFQCKGQCYGIALVAAKGVSMVAAKGVSMVVAKGESCCCISGSAVPSAAVNYLHSRPSRKLSVQTSF